MSLTIISFLTIPDKGLCVIPCVVAHLSQLFIDSVLAAKWAARAEKEAQAKEAAERSGSEEPEGSQGSHEAKQRDDLEAGSLAGPKRDGAERVIEMEARPAAPGLSTAIAGPLHVAMSSKSNSDVRENSTAALRTDPVSDASPLESEDVERGAGNGNGNGAAAGERLRDGERDQGREALRSPHESQS